MGRPMEPVQHGWSLGLITIWFLEPFRGHQEFWSRWVAWTDWAFRRMSWMCTENVLEGWDIGSRVTVQTCFVWVSIDYDNIRSLLGTPISSGFCWIPKINVPLPGTLHYVPTQSKQGSERWSWADRPMLKRTSTKATKCFLWVNFQGQFCVTPDHTV